MAIYAISDLHLSFGVNKPMNIFGKIWDNYEERIADNWKKKVKDDDYVIIPGDISWAMYLSEAKKDFEYIASLPGKKIILKGNHDYYYETKTKVETFFNDNGFFNFSVLQNNAYDLGQYIVCGTRGWGEVDNLLDDKLIKRESLRLEMTIKEAIKIKENCPDKKIILAMHFPPFLSEFQDVIKKYDIYKCIYGHLHGYGHTKIKEGLIDGVEYVMVSCDYTNFDLIRLDN